MKTTFLATIPLAQRIHIQNILSFDKKFDAKIEGSNQHKLKRLWPTIIRIAIAFCFMANEHAFARTQTTKTDQSKNNTYLEYTNNNQTNSVEVYRVKVSTDGSKFRQLINTVPNNRRPETNSDNSQMANPPYSLQTFQAYSPSTIQVVTPNAFTPSLRDFSLMSQSASISTAPESLGINANLSQRPPAGNLVQSPKKTSSQTASELPMPRTEPDSLFKITTKLDCQWAPTDNSPTKFDPKARPFDDQHLKYFGFYASAMQGAGSGDYLLETNRYMHANLAFIASDDINFVLEKLEKAKSLGMKAVVWTQPFLLDQNLHVTNNLTLWSEFSQKISPYVFSNDPTIVAFYILDEPYSNGESWGIPYIKRNLEAAGAISKQYFPTVPLAVIFAASEVYKGGFSLPENFDWFSFDNYGCWDSAECRGGIRGTFEFLADKVSELSSLKSQKKLFAVAESYSNHERASDGEQENIRRRAKRYFQMAQTNDCFVAYMPFIYQTFKDGGGIITGAETMPVVHKEYERQGQVWYSKQKQ